jgi:hypothetical protein
VPGVRHHTSKFDVRRVVQHSGDVEQARQFGKGQASPARAAVDLDEYRESIAALGCISDAARDREIVGNDAHVDAFATHLGDRLQFGRYNSDTVKNIVETTFGKVTSFREGRDGDPAIMTLHGHLSDLNGFRGLEMRSQRHAGLPQSIAHTL